MSSIYVVGGKQRRVGWRRRGYSRGGALLSVAEASAKQCDREDHRKYNCCFQRISFCQFWRSIAIKKSSLGGGFVTTDGCRGTACQCLSRSRHQDVKLSAFSWRGRTRHPPGGAHPHCAPLLAGFGSPPWH